MPTDRDLVRQWWREARTEGLWAAPWHASLEGLTAAQAAWTPAPGRHSIWQHALHICYWQDGYLRHIRGGPRPTPEEGKTGNFPAITDVSEPAWAAARAKFATSYDAVADALADDALDTSRLWPALTHNCYHMGQIGLLRALQGLKPIE